MDSGSTGTRTQQVAQSTPLPQSEPTAHTALPGQTNQVSPDGKYLWNGAAWIPLKTKGHLVRNVGIVVGALLLIGIGTTLANGGANQVQQGASDSFKSPAASPQATSHATAKSTAPSQATLLAAYKAVVAQDNPTEETDISAITTDAGAQDAASLAIDAQVWQVDIKAYLADLPKPPTCLQTADTELRAGLDAYLAAATDIEAGATALDATLLQRAISEMATGTTHFNATTAAVNAASC